MFRPSTSRGRPAFGCTERRPLVRSAIRSIVSSIAAGPTLQFRPMTSAPIASSSAVNCSGGVPSAVAPSSPVVNCATTGFLETARTPRTAAPSSATSPKVSSMNRSTPAASSASACSRKTASASSTPVLPHGSTRTPSGPMAPAT
jgi:hypothetical protein